MAMGLIQILSGMNPPVLEPVGLIRLGPQPAVAVGLVVGVIALEPGDP
jgi:hypothetical protein